MTAPNSPDSFQPGAGPQQGTPAAFDQTVFAQQPPQQFAQVPPPGAPANSAPVHGGAPQHGAPAQAPQYGAPAQAPQYGGHAQAPQQGAPAQGPQYGAPQGQPGYAGQQPNQFGTPQSGPGAPAPGAQLPGAPMPGAPRPGANDQVRAVQDNLAQFGQSVLGDSADSSGRLNPMDFSARPVLLLWGMAGAAVLVVISAFLPWITIGSFTYSGISRDGSLTLICALVAGVAAVGSLFASSVHPKVPLIGSGIAAGMGAIISLIGVIDVLDVGSTSNALGGAVGVGIGLWTTLLFGLVLLALSVVSVILTLKKN
ncbi:MAG: hypothetical protein QM658_09755 [Gordonia sp. (in: high G+C Gram-positive bacteria)]